MKERLIKLLEWAEETYRASPTKAYRDHYGGYIQAIKDVLSMLGEDAFTVSTKRRYGCKDCTNLGEKDNPENTICETAKLGDDCPNFNLVV